MHQPETHPASENSCLIASDKNTAWYPRYKITNTLLKKSVISHA